MTDGLTDSGLKFFGAMTASISHELKNRFAIVNEQAGLLTDLVQMAAKGADIAPERLERLAAAVKKQVSLADDLLKHMNRFSHSVDRLTGETDISLVLGCIAALSKRPADMRNVSLDLRLPGAPVMAQTSAFWLMDLIWTLLDAAMGTAGSARTLTLSCEVATQGALIKIAGATDGDRLAQAVAIASRLITEIRARVTISADNQLIGVLLPA